MLRKTREYIDQCEDEFYDYVKSDGEKSTSWEQKVRAKIPTVEGLSLYLGVNRDTVFEWAKHHQVFSDSLADLVNKQKQMLISGGLGGYYNPTIAKLILSANHGMIERTDVTSDGKRVENINVNIVHGPESGREHSSREESTE